MELELKKESCVFYDTGFNLTGTREETYDAIVPDALPDILRIVESHGMALIGSRELRDGRLVVGGSIRAGVIYVPESGNGLEHIELTIPFSHTFDLHSDQNGVLLCSAEVQSIDSRTINPRKILVRASVRVNARSMEPRNFSICSGVGAKGKEEAAVQLLRREYSVRLPCAVKTKSFTVSDEIEIPSTKPAVKEILKWSCKPSAGDYNIIGRKIVFKGQLSVKLLCKGKGPGDEVFDVAAELPFSQIIEAEGIEEGAECTIFLQPEDAMITVRDDPAGRILSIEASMEAQVGAYVNKRFEAVCDLYSTSMKSAVDIRPYIFTELVEKTSRKQTIRDTVETEMPVRYVQDMEVLFDAVTPTREGNMLRLDTTANVNLLIVGEDGGTYQASRRIPVSVRIEAPDRCDCRVRVDSAAEAFSAAAVNGAEIRFDACFDIEILSKKSVTAVHAVKLENYDADAPVRPSVVLKYPNEGESLWSMAKRYNTTEDDIRRANDLERDAEPDPSRLLLIPKRR